MVSEIIKTAVESFGVILILMLLDLVTGIAKALQHHSIKSAKLRGSINKCIVYFVAILIGGCLKQYGEGSVMTMFVTFILIIEGVSILENLQEMFPQLELLGKFKEILNAKKK